METNEANTNSDHLHMTALQTPLERADLSSADRNIVVCRRGPIPSGLYGGHALLLNILL
jgi:hypothetical protein